MELVDLLSHARREFSFCFQVLLQSFADFSTDCSAVGVINVYGVAHNGPRCPDEPRPMDHSRAFKPWLHPPSLWRVSDTFAFAWQIPAREPRRRRISTRMTVSRLECQSKS